MDRINLTKSDVIKLLNQEIGHGTDGRVFKYNNEYLIKIYHSSLKKMNSQVFDDSDIKIYQGNISNNNFCEPINYYNEDIKLRSRYAIDMVIGKQENIKRTHLPKAPIYIDGRFAGYLLKKMSGIQIHKLSWIPLKYKLKIIEDCIISLKELLDNNVYHVDLANSPYADTCYLNENGKIECVGHSHILVNPLTLKTNMIDLDGKSTIYTDEKNEAYEKNVMIGFCILILEFIFNVDLKEYEENEHLLFQYFEKLEIPKQFVDLLCYCEMNIEQAQEFVKVIKK